MLILTRRISESVVITRPDGVRMTVTIFGVKGNQVRLGFEAPRDTTIDREEIHMRKQNETIDVG